MRLFGKPSTPYPDFYLPKPYSKSFVLHLDSWYAQSHPDEDFAETFAVWLTPDSDWRKRYQDWPALRKLEYMDALMREIAGRRPMTAHAVASSSRSIACAPRCASTTRRSARTTALDYPNFYDRDLRRLFSNAPEYAQNLKASRVIHKIRRDVRRLVAEATGSYQYTIDRVIEDMVARCGRTEPAAEVPGRPDQARLHDARHGADDELSALGQTSGGAMTGVRQVTGTSGDGWYDAYVAWLAGSWSRCRRRCVQASPALARAVSADRAANSSPHREPIDFAWQRLAEVTDTFGPRLSGSENARAGDRLGRGGDEAGRARERPQGTGDGAQVGARPGEPRSHRARPPAAADARPRQLGRHAGRPASKPTSSSSRTSTS